MVAVWKRTKGPTRMKRFLLTGVAEGGGSICGGWGGRKAHKYLSGSKNSPAMVGVFLGLAPNIKKKNTETDGGSQGGVECFFYLPVELARSVEWGDSPRCSPVYGTVPPLL